MTGSRTGIALGIPTLIFLFVMLWPMLRKKRAALYWTGGIGGLVIIGSAVLLQLQSIQKVATRFTYTKEIRWDLWADTWFAAKQVWPFGSGIGTIIPMLEAAERLEVVDQTRPVRAHNDWLEWILEAGVPGLVVLGIVAIVIGALIVRALRTMHRPDAPPGWRAHVVFACGVLTIEALHSIVDYPMRSMALAMLTALSVAFLMNPAASQHNRP
jgi:O-antigen ligase